VRRFGGIRLRVTATIALSLIGVFIVIGYLLAAQNTDRARQHLLESSKSFSSLATKPIGDTFVLYKDSGTVRIAQQVERFSSLNQDISQITIVDIEGKALFNNQNNQGQDIPKELAIAFEQKITYDKLNNPKQVIEPYIEDSGAHRYSVVYSVSSERLQREISETVKLIFYTGLIFLALSIVLTTILLNRLFLKPLGNVSRSAQKISTGVLDQQITTKREDEIGDLARSVNKMAEYLKADIAKLRELDKLKTEFMMITSHNLRTPITIMEGYLDMAETAETVDELKKIAETLQDSTAHLHRLAEDVLTISTIESGELKISKHKIKLKPIIDTLNREFTMMAKAKKIKFEFENNLADDFEMNVSPSHIRSALGSLIDNAIKFTPQDGKINVTSNADTKSFTFKVSDTGIGIEPAEIPKLFTKFHRGTSTLKYDYEGLGIGLYMAKLIVDQHGGQITVNSAKDKGSNFTINLPLSG
jgi:signal transduction histidine kinase